MRREVYLIDKDEDHNLALASVVDDAVKTIDAWLSEGRTVVVHCHGGASRTGLVLRAWLMRHYKWPETRATSFLKGALAGPRRMERLVHHVPSREMAVAAVTLGQY